ncbi:MAG TPA: hypothetical protein VF211_04590 [Burkholderiales bacterium]
MEGEREQQNPDSDLERQHGERRSPTQGVYDGKERRKADQQLDQMAAGQSDG